MNSPYKQNAELTQSALSISHYYESGKYLRKGQDCLYSVTEGKSKGSLYPKIPGKRTGKDRVISLRKVPGERTGMSVLCTWRKPEERTGLSLSGKYLGEGQECLYTVLCILSVPGGKPQERTGLSLYGKYLGKGQECLYTVLCTWREA